METVPTQSDPNVTNPFLTANEVVDYAEGDWLIISGWGSTSPALSQHPPLQVAAVQMISKSDCQAVYPNNISGSMFCAGRLGVGGVDTCQGELNLGNIPGKRN